MAKVVNALKSVQGKFDYITAIETGTIRSEWEKHFSTLHIGNTLGDKGKLYSIDISQKAIDISKKVCKDLNNVEWVLADSLKAIPKLGENNIFQFAFLDSVNDADHILKEFKLILPYMENGSCLVIDDSGINTDGQTVNMTEPRQLKGIGVWEFLIKNDLDFKVEQYNNIGTNVIIPITDEIKKLAIEINI